MITNDRTLTAVTLFGAFLAASLVSQPSHAGIALNGVNLNGIALNGINLQGTSINGSYGNGSRQLGTAVNPAAPTETSGKQVLAIELPPAAE
jgi:hypothetical protein